MVDKTRTAEAVTPKHPDKMCDQISDAVLDWALRRDPKARVAIETLGGHGRVFIAGELTMANMPESEDLEAVLEDIVSRIAGEDQELDWAIDTQSPDIAKGVDTGGAGDQGIMVGYACSDNEAMIPQEAYLARNLAQFIYEKHPVDGKTQITIGDDNEVKVIVASFQGVAQKDLLELVGQWVAKTIPKTQMPTVHANPAGDWDQGGFDADTGLTGRKLMVDNYGPQIPIGGGAFSGKDATKVDRSGAYMARKLAVNMLRELKAKEVTVKLAYAIGIAEPVMATAIVDGKQIEVPEKQLKSCTPLYMIDLMGLRKPQFEETARWGHFGNGFAWDR